jgi:hypothetical protein
MCKFTKKEKTKNNGAFFCTYGGKRKGKKRKYLENKVSLVSTSFILEDSFQQPAQL